MKRLTFDGNFCDIAMCQETPGSSFCEDGYCTQRKVWDRLKQYEDMEEQGLLVRLPCKVGDRVYGIHGGKTILPMVAKWIETNECGWTIAAQYAPMAPKFYLFADFGKTVFTSREAAEKALEEEVCKENTKNT